MSSKTKNSVKKDRDEISYVANVIRTRRVLLDITLVDLADILGVEYQQVQKYENGKSYIRSGTVRRLCSMLQITPNYLFGTDKQELAVQERQQEMAVDGPALSAGTIRIARELGAAAPEVVNVVLALIKSISEARREARNDESKRKQRRGNT